MPPVLNSFSDQDSRVRYYACEALYNIAKVRVDLLNYILAFFWMGSGLYTLMFVVGLMHRL